MCRSIELLKALDEIQEIGFDVSKISRESLTHIYSVHDSERIHECNNKTCKGCFYNYRDRDICIRHNRETALKYRELIESKGKGYLIDLIKIVLGAKNEIN